MSHGSEDAEMLADVVYQFTSMGSEVIHQARNGHRITLRDLQVMKGTATVVLKELERAIQAVTPIEQAGEGPLCTCPPVTWQFPAGSSRVHMFRCPLFRPGLE